ncbi:unnamed protein product [Pseudo-nitzschia multistriata]|uniref:Uncharacterized protein n=1 Tax=Pseudo-nitzschia multistriata TaxID=183589 RepID=A0A448ZAJ3_9STRA|nr:unnamed protein product [Pseudo-nitzschia multistriata]
MNSSSVTNPAKPNQIGVPTAPHTVANVLNISNTTTDSNLGWPVEINMGAPRATGVPNPEAPYPKGAFILAMFIFTYSMHSAMGCPFVKAFISLIIYGMQLVTSMVSKSVIAPAMMEIGEIASYNPKIIDPQVRVTSLP